MSFVVIVLVVVVVVAHAVHGGWLFDVVVVMVDVFASSSFSLPMFLLIVIGFSPSLSAPAPPHHRLPVRQHLVNFPRLLLVGRSSSFVSSSFSSPP